MRALAHNSIAYAGFPQLHRPLPLDVQTLLEVLEDYYIISYIQK
ncbi:hypothetical protein [Bacillus wiedmannii]|nr:hypothetical protein [Bacillus wiedmannii]